MLRFVNNSKLIELDPRFDEYIQVETTVEEKKSEMPSGEKENEEETGNYDKAMSAYLACPVCQIWGYQTYIEDRSPYSTQHGIKGDEFERVLVVLDDEEATYTLYSYEKLLGIQAPSDTDIKNQKEGKDSVFDRTRRLFYVCCSRAVKDLAVVLFTSDVAKAIQVIKAGGIFEADCVKSITDLPKM